MQLQIQEPDDFIFVKFFLTLTEIFCILHVKHGANSLKKQAVSHRISFLTNTYTSHLFLFSSFAKLGDLLRRGFPSLVLGAVLFFKD